MNAGQRGKQSSQGQRGFVYLANNGYSSRGITAPVTTGSGATHEGGPLLTDLPRWLCAVYGSRILGLCVRWTKAYACAHCASIPRKISIAPWYWLYVSRMCWLTCAKHAACFVSTTVLMST